VVQIFTVQPSSGSGDNTLILSWEVSNATSVTIDQGIGNVALKGSRAVSPQTATVYTLTAMNGGSTATANVRVEGKTTGSLFNLPFVQQFYAQPANIMPEWPAILYWDVVNATEVLIEPNIGSVAARGNRELRAIFTTYYKLKAYNAAGMILATTVLTVSGAPPNKDTAVVKSFIASPYVINRGETSVLNWSTQGASAVTMDQGLGTVAAEGSTRVSPSETTTYLLTATSPDGAQFQTATVNVR
jgi:hypothetical protein